MSNTVEIKVTLEEQQLADALAALDLRKASALTVFFLDDIAPGMTLPLLAAGVILRVRVQEGGDEGDATVKLRPCRGSQLVDGWLAAEQRADLDHRIEQDWAGDRHVLAASLQADLTEGTIGRLQVGGPPPDDLLSADQAAYLAACSGIPLTPAGLTTLGPVAATRWKTVRGPGLDELDLRAERWTVAGLDFLELSLKTDETTAPQARHALEAALDAIGLMPDATQETKTRRVLEALAGVS
ncbi:hypothetical protein [Nocardioides sp.]|uniref:hypothetical protein n=1 Tax=Nocardioides sp. TaxID=35761 RepID=UPI003D14B9F3